jgi:hypothetical protein
MLGAALIGPVAAMVACMLGGALGLYAMVNPAWASRLVRLVPMEGKIEGKSEFRATYGGLFLLGHAFGLWAVATGQPGWHLATATLGAGWLGSGVGRLVSIAADRTATTLNWINVAIEAVMGLVLLLPFLATLGIGL